MRDWKRLTYGVLATALLAGCGGSTMTDPGGGGSNGGGTSAGNNAGGSGGVVTGPPAASLSVTVGNNFFRSDRNGTANPAVDTVVAGGKVTWVWVATSSVPHNVQSVGAPSFTSGALETGNGSSYELSFTTPGTYRYNCAVHGDLMTGTVVVLAP